MLEIEIKAYCGDIGAAREAIIGEGGVFRESLREVDEYFNHPARDFKMSDEALRIRRAGGRIMITYKGPRFDSRTKTRFEKEIEVADAEGLREILCRLGFIPVAEVVKNRDIYTLNGIEICVDRVEHVGDFVELEIIGEDRAAAEKRLFDLAARLGLERFESRSYLEMKLSAGK